MAQDGETNDPARVPDNSRRRFLAGAASLIAGMATSSAHAIARSGNSLKPVNQLTRREADALLGSVDKNTLAVVLMLESGGDPNARNPKSSVLGAYQFLPSTARSVGLDPGERADPYLALLGAARLQKQNTDFLRTNIGREPKPFEVYLAHQQGAAGAAALIRGGSKKAIDVLDGLNNVSRDIARQAIVNNGGRADTTAEQFVEIVREFYNKSATSKYSFPAGQKWIAHVAENQGMKPGFLEGDPYFSKKRRRDEVIAQGKRPKVEDPEAELRTYRDILDYVLINPDSKFAKDFPMVTGVVNRIWSGSGEKSEPVKKEEFPTVEKFWERLMKGEKGTKPEPRSR